MSGSSEWEVWKDVAYPGTVVVPGTAGKKHVYNFTHRDMRLLEQMGNAKVADGWKIPLAWEHQDVEPTRLQLSQDGNPERDFALGIFGKIKRFARTPDGRLKALLAGKNADDLRQFQELEYVSPEIQWDWTDTDGKTWHGPSITHVAATARPVQRHQHPVGTDPDQPHPRLAPVRTDSLEKLVRMSLSAGAGSGSCVGAKLRLSLDHYADRKRSAPMADGDKKSVPGMPDSKPNAWVRIAESLEKCGVKIGSGENIKDADHLADLIEVACLNSEQADTGIEDELPPLDEEEDPPGGDMETPPDGTSEPPPPPVQMSMHSKKLLAMHRDELVKRAQRLGTKGHVPPTVANDLVTEVKKVRLSITANGDLDANEVVTKIAAYEKLGPNSAWSKTAADAAGNGGNNKAGAKGTNGKPGKSGVRLSQNARPVQRSPYQENGEEDTDSVVLSYEKLVGRKGFSGDAELDGK